jgi:hypothetical protein
MVFLSHARNAMLADGRWPMVEHPQGGKIPARLFFAVPNADIASYLI